MVFWTVFCMVFCLVAGVAQWVFAEPPICGCTPAELRGCVVPRQFWMRTESGLTWIMDESRQNELWPTGPEQEVARHE